MFQAEVTNLNGHKITAPYGIHTSQETAIIESANTIGLDLIPAADRNPAYASSKGVGELILAALNHNVKKNHYRARRKWYKRWRRWANPSFGRCTT